MLAKERPVRLEGEDYEQFCKLILARDHWKCRNPFCGRNHTLTVHHVVKRSKIRMDIPENCLTLCAGCHDKVEANRIVIEKLENGRFKFHIKGI